MDPRLWNFVADMNGDGAVTLWDLPLWRDWLFYYPGDLLIAFVLRYLPTWAVFLEWNASAYGGTFSGVMSFLFWPTIVVVWFTSDGDEHFLKKYKNQTL
jgi:hypothetical protein